MQTILSKSLGIRQRRNPSEQEKQFVKDNHSGMSIEELAEAVGISAYVMQRWVKELKLTRRQGRQQLQRKEENTFFKHDKNLFAI